MSSFRPRKPPGEGARRWIWEFLWNGQFPFIDTPTVKWERSPNGYAAKAAAASSGGSRPRASGYQGEYDPTKSYLPGDTFIISVALTIRSVVLPKGWYAVRPAATAVDTQTFGPWAGSLPADPASSSTDMDKLFFIPANGLPTLAAAPNDKLYAELVAELC